MKSLRLFSANEFSPGVVNLEELLHMAIESMGDKSSFVELIRGKYFANHAQHHDSAEARLIQQKKLAGNVCIGLTNYGLYDNKTHKLTEFGIHLSSLKSYDLYNEFAVHILKNMNGIEMLSVVGEMQARGEVVGKKSLAKALSVAGFTTYQGKPIPLNTTDHTKMLNWLRLAGVMPSGGRDFHINRSVYEKLLGYSNDELQGLHALNYEQRAFLETFWRVVQANPEQQFLTRDVLSVCRTKHGAAFDEIADQLSSKVFIPLQKLGYFEIVDPGKGRGGKSGWIKACEKLVKLPESVFDVQDISNIPSDLREAINTPMSQVWSELHSTDTYIKGLALEVLAYRIVSMLGLSLSRFRLRSQATNGAEVDLICDGIHLQYSRWLVQCKNMPNTRLDLSVLAKEIGMAYLLKAHVILLITTGEFSDSLKFHAKGLAESSHLQCVLIDRHVLNSFKNQGVSALLSYFRESALDVMKVKQSQVSVC
ncbi:restriction endonuclease [Desulfovibrio subterraneus]|uniref:restriction endonuclease n=1 Tax=Desulfovibrio subterraneus TaxID=2718620 RepID=UPI0022B8F09A|nr:restriction endonuclease [Desulfovibrio subterraneus]WBF66055.1 restriction endonuclease [Desulfovibrio subterraneus]